MKKILLAGLCAFLLVYTGFAFTQNIYVYLFLFALYGCYAAATEGISKAWISNMVPGNQTGTAIGTFAGFQSIASLVASSLTGFIWYRFGSVYGFLMTAGITLVVIIYLSQIKLSKAGID
jgi:MFS family permease